MDATDIFEKAFKIVNWNKTICYYAGWRVSLWYVRPFEVILTKNYAFNLPEIMFY